ncbi:cholesterol esterase [Sorochytrium milnesiophthora]
MAIPLLSRLRFSDYLRLAGAFAFLILEVIIRSCVRVFPSVLVDYVRYKVIGFFPRVFRGFMDGREDNIVAELQHVQQMIELWGYPFEEHIVQSDDYYLGIHRIPYSVHDLQNMVAMRAARSDTSGSVSSSASTIGSVHSGGTPQVRRRKTSMRKKLRTPSSIISMFRNVVSSAEEEVPLPLQQAMLVPEDATSPPLHKHARPVVLLWHGFMMCSEVWVCSRLNSLALMLSDEGYDVWLGNNRGNKYSFKHKRYSPSTATFWDFSLDEYAQDLATVVEHILTVTEQQSLIYIGFSQGTAQLFAALSSNPKLNSKIRLACCLAPTGKPHGVRESLVTSLIKSSPHLLFLLFGRKAAIPSAIFWRRMLSREIFVRALDQCMHLLFNWSNSQMTFDEKIAHYAHLYSPASVKSVVHWFQIIRSGFFQMYDDAPGFLNAQSMTHVAPRYPLSNIKTPIALFYGAADTLSDISFLIADLPKPAFVLKVMDYEHLDCIWASSAHKIVFPGVIGVMALFGRLNPDGSKAAAPIKAAAESGASIADIERVLSHGIMAQGQGNTIMELHKLAHEDTPYTRIDREEMLRLVVNSDGILTSSRSTSHASLLPQSTSSEVKNALPVRNTSSPSQLDEDEPGDRVVSPPRSKSRDSRVH